MMQHSEQYSLLRFDIILSYDTVDVVFSFVQCSSLMSCLSHVNLFLFSAIKGQG